MGKELALAMLNGVEARGELVDPNQLLSGCLILVASMVNRLATNRREAIESFVDGLYKATVEAKS